MSAKPNTKKAAEYRIVVTTALIDSRNFGKVEMYIPTEINNLISGGWKPVGGPSMSLQTRREMREQGLVENVYMILVQAIMR